MNSAHTQAVRNRVQIPFGFFAGPILWALQIIVGYGLASLARQIRSNWPVDLALIISAVIVLIAAILSLSAWRSIAHAGLLEETNVSQESANFWAISGFIISLIFFLTILATFIYGLFLSPLPIITMLMP